MKMNYFKKSHVHPPEKGKGSYRRGGVEMENPDRIVVDYEVDDYDCDCCGFLANISAKVYLNGEIWFDAYHDSHFGGGGWTGEDDDLYALMVAHLLDGNVMVEMEDEDGGRSWPVVIDQDSGFNHKISVEEDGWASIISYNQTVYACFLKGDSDSAIVELVQRYFESEGMEIYG